MTPQERPLTPDELADLRDFQEAGRTGIVEVAEAETPHAIVEAIGAVSSGLRELDEESMVHASLCLGVLWGEQVHRAVGWEWVLLSFGGSDDEVFALVSADRAFYILPGYLLLPYATAARVDDTSVLLFNMLVERALPAGKPWSYCELA